MIKISVGEVEEEEKIRVGEVEEKVIIAIISIGGGIGAYQDYHRILEVADYVYFGDGFSFDMDGVYSKEMLEGKESIEVKKDVDFENIPIMRTGKRSWYYLLEVGCPFKCEYCFVSHLNKYCSNTIENARKVLKTFDIKYHGQHVALISNEGLQKVQFKDLFAQLKNNSYEVQSIPVGVFLKNKQLFNKQKIIRVGVELPTEKARAEILPPIKQFKNEELIKFIEESKTHYISLFMIYAYFGQKLSDYDEFIDVLLKANFGTKRVRVSFTTLHLQPYTPIYSRFDEYLEHMKEFPDMTKELQYKIQSVSQVKLFQPELIVNTVYKSLFSYLPADMPVTKPRQGEKTKDYLKRIMVNYHPREFIEFKEKSNA